MLAAIHVLVGLLGKRFGQQRNDLTKGGSGTSAVSTRTDSPRRETLRRELARIKPTGRRAGLKPKLVLASASPRRLMLLGQVGVEPDALRPSSIDEQPFKGEMPRSLVTGLSRAKAEVARDEVANDKDVADAYVLAADTVVAVGRRILVKPRFVEEELATLQLLSGRNHRVLTGICLITPDDRVRIKIVDTRVRFKRLCERGDRGLHRLARVARQGGRVCHPGPRRLLRAEAHRLLHQRGGSAAHRSGQYAAGRGLSHPLQLAEARRGRPGVAPASPWHPPRIWRDPSQNQQARRNARSAAGRRTPRTGRSARAAAPTWTSAAGSAAPTRSPSRTTRRTRTAGRERVRSRITPPAPARLTDPDGARQGPSLRRLGLTFQRQAHLRPQRMQCRRQRIDVGVGMQRASVSGAGARCRAAPSDS